MTKTLRQTFTPRAQSVLLGAALGAAAFLLLYGIAPLNVTNDAWLRGGYVEKDATQHYVGWLFYRDSPWSWPLGVAQRMGWPQGSYVGFTDSIPLFAVLVKLLAPLLPAIFQYFGWWGLLCCVLQGGCAALLLSLFTGGVPGAEGHPVNAPGGASGAGRRSRGLLQNALLCLLFIFAPIFLDRLLRHGALGAQWLILLALYLYFSKRRSGRYGGAGFPVLCALAIAIHPYFVPMVLALVFALLAEHVVFHWHGSPKPWWRRLGGPLGYLLLCLGAVLATGYALGAFSGGAGGGSTPYGFFSMNLNALFNPIARGYHWSLLLPEQNQIRGNYDGFNYLGLGLLLALAVVGVDVLLHLRKWQIPARLRQRFGLIFVCLCLTAFAISNEVTAQGRLWFALPLPRALTELAGVFRSSGRMFYPVWYLLALCACVWVVRRPPPKWRTLAAGALVAVQLIDLSPALVQKYDEMHPYTAFFQSPMQSGFWDQAAGRYAHLASLDTEGLSEPIEVARWAADNGMTTDDSFGARHDTAAREAQIQAHLGALTGGTWAADTLYLTSREAVFLELAEALAGEMYCARVDGYWYVLAPYNGGFTGPGGAGDVTIAEYPLMILDYSDANWEHGVLNWDYQTVCFSDTAFSRRRIDGMAALRAEGVDYPITEVSYRDKGWIMVTLDIADATVLQGVPLEGVPRGDAA